MANRSHQTTWKDVLFFWVKVLVACIILGVISFFIGRNYLGDMIADTKIEQETPEVVAEVPKDQSPAPGDKTGPPDEANVEVYEREPSDAEVERARKQLDIAEGSSEKSAAGEQADQKQPDVNEDSGETTPGQASSTDSEDAEGDREFVVIAGSFVKIENAEEVVSELRGEGYEPYITQVVIGGTTYNRVNVASYPSRKKAGELAEELRAAGHDVTVGVR